MREADPFQVFLAVFAAIVLAWFTIELVSYAADEWDLAGGVDRPFQSDAQTELEDAASPEPAPASDNLYGD